MPLRTERLSKTRHSRLLQLHYPPSLPIPPSFFNPILKKKNLYDLVIRVNNLGAKILGLVKS